MSSEHTWISNEEYRRLQRGDIRTRQAEEALRQIQAGVQQREREIASRYQTNVETLQSNINTMSQQHGADMRRVSQEFRSNIARQAAEFQEQLSSQREQNRRDIQSLETRVGRAIGQINVNMREIDNRVTAVATDFSNRFNEIARAQVNKQAYAEASIIEMNDLLTSIRNLHPEKFAPGEFEALSEQLARARSSFDLQQYEAALAITQVRMTDAARLMHRLSMINALFYETLSGAREQANAIQQRILTFTDGKPAHEFELAGENYSLPFDINYWTNERFAEEVQSRMAEISRLLDTAESNPEVTLTSLETMQREMEGFDGESGTVNELYALGREEQMRSFVVGDMAIQVHNALSNQGWHLIDSGRYEEDDRKPYTMTYADGTGNQVALVVSPGEKPEDTAVAVEVYVNGDDNGKSVYSRDIKEGLGNTIDSLSGDGVQVGRRERRNDCLSNPTPEAFIRNIATENLRRLSQVKKI